MATKPEYREDGFRSGLTFPEPATSREAERKVIELQNAVSEIEAQLSSRNRRDPMTGQRLDSHAYWEWRRRAISARALKAAELRFVNNWLREHRRQMECAECRARMMAEGMTCRPWE
ncbi:MAG: hypothetical protein ACE149_19595 [Armatimonadota bacterium]